MKSLCKVLQFAFIVNIIFLISCNKSSADAIKSAQVIPIAPTSLNGVVLSNTKISLSWTDNSTNEDGYKIERKTTNTNYIQLATISKDITLFTDSTLSPNTEYIYRVYSYNSAGSSASYSNELSLKTKLVPQITTNSISSISYRSALGGATITSDGGSPIIARGIIWDTLPSPTLKIKSKTSDSVGIGNFISTISNLNYNTKYYVRAYVINSTDTSYGNEISFSTLQAILPSITTTNIDPTTIKSTRAIGGGNITFDGGSDIIARGVVWNTSSAPTVNLQTKSTDGIGIGEFQSYIEGLFPNTKYYIRAYAINNIGVTYGNEISFITPAPSQVVIGTQQWMKENLDVSTYRNGDVIPQVTDPSAWAGLTTGAWCYYDNDPANGAIYGKLYNGYAVDDPRGLAPQGWHIPTEFEWDILFDFLGENAGGKMKTTGTPWFSPNIDATNESGFAGLPGAQRVNNGVFNLLGVAAYWWSTPSDAFARHINVGVGQLYGFGGNKNYGLSVRCIKD